MRMLAPERTLDESLLIAFYRNNRLVGDNLAAAGVGNGETVAVGSRLRGSGSTGVPCGAIAMLRVVSLLLGATVAPVGWAVMRSLLFTVITAALEVTMVPLSSWTVMR